MSADRVSVEHQVVSVVHHIDGKRWGELRDLFAPMVRTDYTSLFGGNAVEQSADDLVGMWRKSLGSVTTQHLLGPIDVDLTADGAKAACHVRAMHHAANAKGGTDWEVLGHYRFELERSSDGLKITKLTLDTFHQIGNRQLLQESS